LLATRERIAQQTHVAQTLRSTSRRQIRRHRLHFLVLNLPDLLRHFRHLDSVELGVQQIELVPPRPMKCSSQMSRAFVRAAGVRRRAAFCASGSGPGRSGKVLSLAGFPWCPSRRPNSSAEHFDRPLDEFFFYWSPARAWWPTRSQTILALELGQAGIETSTVRSPGGVSRRRP
jgi:hypothetical protein